MSMIKDIADYLEIKELGTVGVDLFKSSIPPEPETAIGVYQYAGRPSDLLAGIDKPGLQIRCRSSDYETTIALIESVEGELSKIGDEYNGTLSEGVEINGTFYFRVQPIQPAFPVGEDGSERIEFVQNYQIDMKRRI